MRIRPIAGVLVATALLAASSGCTPAARPVTDTKLPVVESSTPVPVETTLTVSSGAVTTPKTGSAVRTALMDAARASLGTTTKFVVHQLYVQGDAAVGDIQPESGSPRMFIAWTGGPDAWEVGWTANFGAPEANAAQLVGALPQVSKELADRISWKLVLATPDAQTLASFKKYVQASVKNFTPGYGGGFTYTYKIAKAKNGLWYGSALAHPDQDGLESLGIYGVLKSGKWTGRPADFSVDDDEGAFFPADVVAKLRL